MKIVLVLCLLWAVSCEQSVQTKAMQADKVQSQSVQTQSLSLGQLTLSDKKISLGTDTLIQIGANRPFPAQELLHLVEYTHKVVMLCGEDFSRCHQKQGVNELQAQYQNQMLHKLEEKQPQMRFQQQKDNKDKDTAQGENDEQKLDEQVDELLD